MESSLFYAKIMHLLEQIEARRHPRHMVFCDSKFQFFKVFEVGFRRICRAICAA